MELTALFVQETITGNPVMDLTHLLDGGPYTDKLVGFGDATITLAGTTEVEPGQITPAGAYAGLILNAHSIVLADVDSTTGAVTAVKWAGVILDVDYADESQKITIYAEQLRTLFQARMTFGVGNFPQGDLTITNQPRGTAAALILARATAWGFIWQLPLDLPSGGTGAFSTSVSRWDISTIEDVLVQLEKYGTEIRFQPYLTGARQLRYQVIVAERITTTTTNILVTAENSAALKYTAGRTGRRQTTGAFVTGKGMGSQMPTAGAGLGGAGTPGVPVRDSYRPASDMDAQSVLQGYADSDFTTNRYGTQRAGFQVIPDDVYTHSRFLPGAVLVVERRGHAVLPDDITTYRVTALAGDLTSKVLTPELEA